MDGLGKEFLAASGLRPDKYVEPGLAGGFCLGHGILEPVVLADQGVKGVGHWRRRQGRGCRSLILVAGQQALAFLKVEGKVNHPFHPSVGDQGKEEQREFTSFFFRV